MENQLALTDGFLSSHTKSEAAAWSPPPDLRKRLVARGWPFTAAFGTGLVSDSFDLCAFVLKHRRWPNYRKTGYFNDFLYFMKHSRDNLALRRRATDKELAKQFLKELLGAEYTVPTLDVIEQRDALPDYRFPLNSVVKPTHLSGHIYLCGERQPSAAERAAMQSWFDIDYALITGEWNYRGLRPKVIVEPFLSLNDGASHDIRFFAYQGKVRVVELYSGRYRGATLDYFDRDWKRIPDLRAVGYPLSSGEPVRPQQFDRMLELAERIGREFSFVRVDFFTDFADRFYIGELTHCTGNGRVVFAPTSSERYFLMDRP